MEQKLRILGFFDAWTQRKLGEVCGVTFGGGTPSTATDEYWNGNIPWLQSSDIIEHDVTSVNLRKYITKNGLDNSAAKLVPANSIAVVTRVGVGKLSVVPFDFATSQDFLTLSDMNIDIWYGVYFLYRKLQRELNSVQGTSIKGITKDELLNKEMAVPSTKTEQSAIGTFFRTLDELLAATQRKVTLLKQLKAAYLQQMFPQAGEKVLRVRFSGFSEEWEQRKLEYYFTERSERSGDGELISVTINSGVVKASELGRQIISSEDKSNYKAVRIGDIAYNSMRMWQGASGYSPHDGILSPAYTVIKPKENAHSPFFAYLFKKFDMIQIFQRNSQGLTSDTWNLKFPAFSQIGVLTPSLDEQHTIANFFELFDENIESQSQRIVQLQRLKSAYLQKMFV